MADEKPRFKMKTITKYIDKKYKNVLDDMCKTSKNIYNISLYCHNIYTLFQTNIYEDFYEKLKATDDIKENYNKLLLEAFNKYYIIYSHNKEINNENNKIIYNHLKEGLNNVILNCNNIPIYEMKYMNELKGVCKFDSDNKFFVYDNNIKKIIKSFYDKQYNTMKNELLNKKPFTYNDKVLEEEVKNDKYYYKKTKKPAVYMINNNKVELKSNQAMIKYIILHGYLGENRYKLPSDVIGTIIDKFYMNIQSYYGLLNKHLFARKPRFINDEYNNLYYTYRSFKQYDKYVRLTVGEHIAKNYNKLLNNNFISHDDRKYYPKNCITTKKGANKVKIDTNKYIDKSNLIDAYYINISIPKKLQNKEISYLQIKKIHNRYKLYITYDDGIKPKNKIPKEELIEKSISIDTGIINLMTIYNPTDKQHIIKGNKLLSINSFYNKKINELKSINKKNYNKCKFNRLYSLLEERKNKLEAEINKTINTLIRVYHNKDIFIIGYNERWKNRVNLGTNINKKFYQIPYRYILDKLRDKLENLGKELIITEESYTSKCDSLSLEEIKRKDEYNGYRKERGLYVSKIRKAINADLNGAINIMRKVYELKELTGKRIYNPEVIKIQ